MLRYEEDYSFLHNGFITVDINIHGPVPNISVLLTKQKNINIHGPVPNISVLLTKHLLSLI